MEGLADSADAAAPEEHGPSAGFWRVIAFVVTVTIVIAVVAFLPGWQLYWSTKAGATAEQRLLEDEYRRILVLIVGGVVILAGLFLTYRRTRATEEGQITERFTRAIERLGDQQLAVQLGGIYALARIARDSPTDSWTCIQTLCAFLRERPRPSLEERAISIALEGIRVWARHDRRAAGAGPTA